MNHQHTMTLLALAGVSFSAAALEYPSPFKIAEVFVSGPANFHFRVHSDQPDAWHCHNGPKHPAWSYINDADPGSKIMISALLTAYASKKTVTLATEGVDTPNGRFCRIIEFKISD